jgi:G3E family GTPase
MPKISPAQTETMKYMTTPSLTQDELKITVPKQGMPVTIITGFLGSGKTTLLNQILQNRQDLKVAVLVNEFGDINIDSQLLISIDEDMVELSNGCICCTINDGLVDAVYKVLERENPVDYLVIETTGVADPLPIVMTFLGTDLRDLTRLDSILTVVDTETFTPEHFDSDAAFSQIVYGDIILLNKTDLVAMEQVDELEDYICAVKVGARVIRSQYGKVPLPLLLDVGYADSGSYLSAESPSHGHKHEHHEHHESSHASHEHHHHSEHLANDGFMSVSFVSDRPFNIHKFQEFLDELPKNIFRAKGVLWFQESGLRHIFQLSGKRCSLSVDHQTLPSANQLVFIGRELDADGIRQGLSQCHAPSRFA